MPSERLTPGFRLTCTLFIQFFRLGLTAFGGPAMIAYIRDLAVVRSAWLNPESFKQGVALCQTLPGATAMQVAAYVGLQAGGPWGAMAAYIGFGLPAFFFMLVLSALYQSGQDLAVVLSIFAGLQAIVIALVAHATYHFGRNALQNRCDALLGLGVAVFLIAGGHPIFAIVAAALLGLLLYQDLTKGKPGNQQAHPVALKDFALPLALTLLLAAGVLVLFWLNRPLFELVSMMIKVDLFAFGGGYGSVPLMFTEVVTGQQWLTSKTFLDGIALGQVTPGPIVITATFVGYLHAGLPGALAATVGIFAPSLILLTAAAPSFDRFRDNRYFQRAVRGVLISFIGLLLSVTVRFTLALPWEPYRCLIVALALLALWRKVAILWIVLAGAAFSAAIL